MKADLAARKAILGKALCFLRLVRGIHSLRMADRIYRERISPGAPPSGFSGQLSKWERGVDPSAKALLDALAVLDAGLSDLETALDVMVLVASKGMSGLRRSYGQNGKLRVRIEGLVRKQDAGDDTRTIVLDAATIARDR